MFQPPTKNLLRKRVSKKQIVRGESAFSLVAIAMICFLVTLIMVGSGASLLSFYRTNATDSTAELQTSVIADSAANYITALLCDPESRNAYDVTIEEPLRIITISPAELNLPTLTADRVIAIKAIIKNTAPTNSQLQNGDDSRDFFPIAYDPRIDPINNSPIFTTNYWRTLTILVQYGSNKGSIPYWKGLIVALKPTAKVASAGSTGLQNPTNSFFTSAAYGKNSVSLDNAVSTDSFSNSLGSSNKDFSGVANVGGHIGAGSSISMGQGVSIGGQVQFNSQQSSVTLNPSSSAQINEIIQIPSGSTISYSTGTLPTSLVKLLSPSGTYPNPVVQSPPTVTDVPSLAAPDKTPGYSSDITTPQGDYVIDPSQIADASLNNLANPVRLFVESSGGANETISFPNSLGTNNLPANLEIWYNGQGTLNFNGQSISASVYAPYAKINIESTTGTPATFSGAIVGNNINLKTGTKVRFDTRLASPSYSNVGFNMNNLNFATVGGANSLRWQVQSVKDLNRAEFLSQ